MQAFSTNILHTFSDSILFSLWSGGCRTLGISQSWGVRPPRLESSHLPSRLSQSPGPGQVVPWGGQPLSRDPLGLFSSSRSPSQDWRGSQRRLFPPPLGSGAWSFQSERGRRCGMPGSTAFPNLMLISGSSW